MKTTDTMVLFWATREIYSNWHPAVFEVGGVQFNCTEQFMMYRKAMLFGDTETAQAVLAEPVPRAQKALGRQVKNFDDALWVAHREQIMFDGCYAKFSQNPAMKAALLATGEHLLVEASPDDRIWGIGLHETDPLAHDPATWQGLNLLGKALMQVREALAFPG